MENETVQNLLLFEDVASDPAQELDFPSTRPILRERTKRDLRLHLTELINLHIFKSDRPEKNLHALAGGLPYGAFPDVSKTALADLVGQILSPAGVWDIRHAAKSLAETSNDYFECLSILESLAIAIGRRWEDDSSTFTQISIATSRLLTLMRGLAQHVPPPVTQPLDCCVAVLTPPGEEHVFTACLLEEHFHQRGWQTTLELPKAGETINFERLAALADVFCLSWSSGSLVKSAMQTVSRLKACKQQGHALVLAGGGHAAAMADDLARAGVDCVCPNSYTGIALAERFVTELRKKTTAPN